MAEVRPEPISADAVRRLIAQEFPQFAGLPVRQLAAFGTDHLLFRVGGELLARLPANADAARNVVQQSSWLARFSALPLEVPQVVGVKPPSALWPNPWTLLGWIDGADAAMAEPANWAQAAETLGRFLAALRDCDPSGGMASGRGNALRGAPLAALDPWMRQAIAAISGRYDPARLTTLWDEALAAPAWTGRAVWVHGDLHAGNLVVRDGRLVAAIDFGLVSVGDPACDLAPAWTFLPGAQRGVFRQAAGLDGAAWQRGKGWALYAGAIALAHHGTHNPLLATMGRKAISAVLDSE